MYNKIATYVNGNVIVALYEDGTKVRTELADGGFGTEQFPESIDVKITNYCDGGCSYCHEESTTRGKHGDLESLYTVLEGLPAGIELAIGGGNPLDCPMLKTFLRAAKREGWICNMTVNQQHINNEKLTEYVENELVKGVGVSIIKEEADEGLISLMRITPNVVFHVIAGVHEPSIIPLLAKTYPYAKVLVLGYKTFGRGVKKGKSVDDKIEMWRAELPLMLGKFHISFDNLALEQLDIKKWIPAKIWEQSYMGDDFTISMYIDAVEEVFSPTSRSPKEERVSFNDSTLLEYFRTNKK